MLTHCKLGLVILVLTLHDYGYAGLIIGGHEAEPHSRPYMVLLERYMADGVKKYCGGFLLNEDFVMTAAHCQAKTYIVKLGVHEVYDDDGVQSIIVEQAFPRNDYNESQYVNDVMLLKVRTPMNRDKKAFLFSLSTKAQFNEKVKPIELPGLDDGSLPKSCAVSGWGRHDQTGFMSTMLREVNVTLIDIDDCAKQNSYCSAGEIGPGKGDSGGPLVCEGVKAYGVVSSMFEPPSGGPPLHRFAKIPDYRRWITSTTKGSRKDLMSVEFYKVYLGVHKFPPGDNKVEILSVAKAFPHEKFNAAGFRNDIMLLKLASNATISSNVQPVTLAIETNDFQPKSCVVSGWGQTNRTKSRNSHTLLEVNVTLTDSKLCGDENSYCSKGDHGPGSGDSGGPLICEDGRVYGVVSASKAISQDILIYKYANIPDNRDWIDNIMSNNE
ncbi:granzyme B(G,H)-like [Xenentodon cancila]